MGLFLIAITIWFSMAFYLAACLGFLGYFHRGVQTFWTLSWLFFMLHFVAAYHFFHGWSQAHAYDYTEEVSGFGPGIYFTYLFTALWTGDVLWFWWDPKTYIGRPRWVTIGVHAVLLFFIFNGTVVFTHGLARALGVVLFVALGGALVFSPRKHQATLSERA